MGIKIPLQDFYLSLSGKSLKIRDGQKMKIGGIVPQVRQRIGNGRGAPEKQLYPRLDMGKIGKPYHNSPAHPQCFIQHNLHMQGPLQTLIH